MALEQTQGTVFQLPSKPFTELLPSAWLINEEYEQFLDYLAQMLNDSQERINEILDFYDLNKTNEKFLKVIAYNLGIEIPIASELTAYAKRLIQSAINVYRTKGTFDSHNTSGRGIGLWIKAATGYDISIQSLPIINPFMYVNQLNYRCVLANPETSSVETIWKAVHPYEKDVEGNPRELTQWETPHYATGGLWLYHVGMAIGRNDSSQIRIRLNDLESSDVFNIPIPPNSQVGNKSVCFLFNNRAYSVFGTGITFTPLTTFSHIPFVSKEAYSRQEWTTEQAILPAGIMYIAPVKPTQIKTFRSKVFFFASVVHNNLSSEYRICCFDVLTKTVTLIPNQHSLTVLSLVTFSETKAFYLYTNGTYKNLQVIDLITGEESLISVLRDSVFTSVASWRSVSFSKGKFFFLVDNKNLIIFDMYTETAIKITLNYNGAIFSDLLSSANFLFVSTSVMGVPRLCIFNINTVLNAPEGQTIKTEMADMALSSSDDIFYGLWEDHISSGCQVYPSTLIINIESYGEFQSDRTLYSKKMEVVRQYISRYIQSGILPVINDDN